jgi:phosphoenolpyruvate carboxylase
VGAKQETREVLDTCKVIAEAPRGSIAAYVISMAKTPSDVLAVHLLLKEPVSASPCRWPRCSKPWTT